MKCIAKKCRSEAHFLLWYSYFAGVHLCEKHAYGLDEKQVIDKAIRIAWPTPQSPSNNRPKTG